MPRGSGKLDLENYTWIGDIAAEYSVDVSCVWRWLKRRGYLKWPHYVVVKRRALVRMDIAELYDMDGRRAKSKPPKGWRRLKSFGASNERTFRLHFSREMEAKRIRVRKWHGAHYVHPDDAAYLWSSYGERRQKPLANTITAKEFAERAGVAQKTISNWARQKEIPKRIIRVGRANTMYLDPKYLEDFLAYTTGPLKPKGVAAHRMDVTQN